MQFIRKALLAGYEVQLLWRDSEYGLILCEADGTQVAAFWHTGIGMLDLLLARWLREHAPAVVSR